MIQLIFEIISTKYIVPQKNLIAEYKLTNFGRYLFILFFLLTYIFNFTNSPLKALPKIDLKIELTPFSVLSPFLTFFNQNIDKVNLKNGKRLKERTKYI